MILTPLQIAQAMYNAGFRGNSVAFSTAIAMAESGGNTEAVSPVQPDGTRGYGLCQIETENLHGGNWQDPTWQAVRMLEMSSGGANYNPWCTSCQPMPGLVARTGCNGYGSGSARLYLAEAYQVAAQVQPTNGWPGVLLKVGVVGHGTKAWQTFLHGLGNHPHVIADDVFGPITEGATLDYQRKSGLVADGVVGPSTWSKAFGA